MNRAEFEALRDLQGKAIEGDIKLIAGRRLAPLLTADDIEIANTAGRELKLNITFHPLLDSITFNVTEAGNGPVCRLDIRGTAHKDQGRTHKHSLQDESSPRKNLGKGVAARPDLETLSIQEAWQQFCMMAKIDHNGTLIVPPQLELASR